MDANIILLNGKIVPLHQWQELYYLTKGSSKIGRYFDIGEPSFRNDLTISEAVIRILDVIRIIRDKPVIINSLDRTEEQQQNLRLKGYRAAKTSPHVVSLAADIDTISKEDTLDLVGCVNEAAEILGYDVRVGYKDYLTQGQTFVHIDVCPMYYGRDQAWYHKSHPKVWESQITW